jgi:uncharacterized protein YabE (DUF348 family)
MKSILRKSKPPRGILAAAALFAVSVMGIVFSAHTQADSQRPTGGDRLITVHDQGVEKSFLTRADTLRSALEGAHIRVDKNDLVEPNLDGQLVASNYEVNIYRARPVTIVDGATRKRVISPYRTAKQIVEHAGMTLHDEDETDMAASADLVGDGSGVQLEIDRATEFTLKLYGKSVTAYTQAATVGEMLKEKGITLAPQDTLAVSEDTPITAGMKVEIWRNGKQTFTQEETIKPPVRQVQDADQPVGYKKVRSEGKPGKKTVTYEIVMKNGKEVSRKVIQTVVLEKAEERIEVVGTKPDFGGDFAAALLKLRTCESGNNYANKNNPLYRGAYQYSYETWGNRYGVYDPADATPAQQDAAVRETYLRRGWQPWPNCGASLPDTYR